MDTREFGVHPESATMAHQASSEKETTSATFTHGSAHDAAVVEDDTDTRCPHNWSKGYKWMIVCVLALMSLAGNLATIMCAPASPQILASFGSDNSLYSTLLVSIWELGEGIGPLIIAPISERYGRRIAYNGANLAFVICNVLATVSVDLPMLIVVRFLNGVAVASVTLNPCVVGDLFPPEERGKAMSLMNFPALLGPVAGPIIGGYVAQAAGWRWVFGTTAIFAGVSACIFLVLYPETYYPVILRSRDHRRANEPSGDERPESTPAAASVKMSLLRPLQMLVFSPIVACMAVYASLAYGYVYIVFTTLPSVFEGQYHFSGGPVGLTYLGVALGVVVGVVLCSMTLDTMVKASKAAGRAMAPEQRLPILAVGYASIAAGFFLYGWTAEYKVQWAAPIVGTALIGVGLVSTMVSTSTYMVDAFPTHAASALAAVGILRSLAAAGLPLVGPPMYQALGLGWGNSVLGFVAMFGVLMVLVLIRYGERVRRRSG